MKRLTLILLSLSLLACTSAPQQVVPPLRMSAEDNHTKALQAIRADDVRGAVEHWQAALVQYQALDDWSGQGMARLGLAQALWRMRQPEQALVVLDVMLHSALFADSQRAQAYLQVAQINLRDPKVAERELAAYLSIVNQLCGKPCALQWSQLNLSAKLALRQRSWMSALELAGKVLELAPVTELGERAHALAIKAHALLELQQLDQALAASEAAIELDRQLARPELLLEDYRLQLLILNALQKQEQAQLVEQRIASLCQALSCE